MYESDCNRFDPESQFMLTCLGKRLPVSTGSPPGDCLQERSEAASPDSPEGLDRDNDLAYKLDREKRIPLQDSTASSGDSIPPSVLKFTQTEKGLRKCSTASPGIQRAISLRENLLTENASIQAKCSYRGTGDLRPPGSLQCIQLLDTSKWQNSQNYSGSTGNRKSDTYSAQTTIFTYSAKQSRDVSPTLLSCFPSGCDVRRVSNLHSPPGNLSTFKTIIK